MKMRIFTDGACSENPGPGGWSALFSFANKQIVKSGCEKETTNNRMELLAAVKALEYAVYSMGSMEHNEVEIHSDSAYVVNSVNKRWLVNWQRNGWKSTSGEVKNQDLWKKLIAVMKDAKQYDIGVKFVKVKGHSGNTFNDIVDAEAKAQVDKARKLMKQESL